MDQETTNVQSDTSSGSDDNLDTELQGLTLVGLESHELATTSSDLELRDNFALQQQPTHAGIQQASVNITGGDLTGSQLIGTQMIHQHFDLTRKENIDQRQIQATINVYPNTQPQQQPIDPAEDDPQGEYIQLADSIRMFHKKEINNNVFQGERRSKITEPKPLAIKSLKFNERNKREAQILTKLRPHENVVSIVQADIYYQGPVPYIFIAMELCHTQNLHDHIAQKNVPFDPQLSISQAKQLAKGLEYIHINNIIHRDLKPQNVLFSLDKKTVKIADFGISKEMTSGRTVTDITYARAGTDGYRAPETYNCNEISQRADIYSMGLVFYFLWSNGHHAFGDDPDDWNSNIKKGRNRDLSALALKVDDQEMATDLLQWMLQFAAEKRPTTAQILNHKFFSEAESSLKVPVISATSGARSKIRNPSTSNDLKSRDEQQASTSSGPKEKKSSSAKVTKGNVIDLDVPKAEAKHYLAMDILQQNAKDHVMGNQPCVDDVIMIISSCQSLRLSPDDVVSIADKHLEDLHLVRAYVMYLCAGKIFMTDSEPSDAFVGITKCITKMENVVRAMADSPLYAKYNYQFIAKKLKRLKKSHLRKTASKYVVPSMYDMLVEVRKIEDISDDVKVKNEAACLCSIAMSHISLEKLKIAGETTNEGIELMRSTFGAESDKHRIFGDLLHSSGIGKYFQEFYQDSEVYFEQAMHTYQKAEDFSTELERNKKIGNAKRMLRFLKKKV